jgi:6-phosphogluconolactonase
MMPLLRFSAAGILLAGIMFALPVPILKHAPKQEYFLYVGSKGKQGILIYRFDPANATLTPAALDEGLAAALPGVTALVPHPGNRFLYAVTANSVIASYAIHQDNGALRLLNTVESQRKDACAITVEKKGWMLMISFCGSGSVESFRVAGDGAIGESTGVQQHEGASARPRNVVVSPDNFFIYIPDLDKVFQYRFDPARAIFWPNDPPSVALKAGAHPVSLVIRQDEKFAYAADEGASAVATFIYNRDPGTMKLLDSISTSSGKPSALEIDPAGKFLYLASTGDDSVTVLAIDRKKGTPKIVGKAASGGKAPAQLRVDPSGRFLFVANMGSHKIAVFQIDPKTGLLTATSMSIDVPGLACFQLVPIHGEGIH